MSSVASFNSGMYPQAILPRVSGQYVAIGAASSALNDARITQNSVVTASVILGNGTTGTSKVTSCVCTTGTATATFDAVPAVAACTCVFSVIRY